MHSSRPATPQYSQQNAFLQLHQPDAVVIRRELHAGLLAPQPHVSPKYLYDALGSKLFEAICELDEYYPTRTEAAILSEHLKEIEAVVPKGSTLIDLGAGNCGKAVRLFESIRPAQYVPVDISVDFLREAVANLHYRFPDVDMLAVGMDFSTALDLPEGVRRHRRLFFYPGSSIGNYMPAEALAFLKRIRLACGDESGILIGVDLVKDAATLDAAYDDALGVTAAFNLNLLRHLNRLLGADFHLPDWRHHAFFNTEQSRIEMHLKARRDVTVKWNGGERIFSAQQGLHTENSYKYTPEHFTRLLHDAGFTNVQTWSDPERWFMVCHAAAA